MLSEIFCINLENKGAFLELIMDPAKRLVFRENDSSAKNRNRSEQILGIVAASES